MTVEDKLLFARHFGKASITVLNTTPCGKAAVKLGQAIRPHHNLASISGRQSICSQLDSRSHDSALGIRQRANAPEISPDKDIAAAAI